MAAPYPWLIFDADGTLFDFRRGEKIALEATILQFGLTYSEGLLRVYKDISHDLWGRFERGEINSEQLRVERFRRLFNELGISIDPVDFNQAFMASLGQQRQLLPGAEELVKNLSSEHRLLLATNGIAVVQRSRLGESSIRPYFEDVVISDEIGAAKPQIEYMVEAFSRMGDPPKADVLMIGDGLSSDIAGGTAFGIDTCWFNPDGNDLDGSPKPTYTIADLNELPAIVANPRSRRTV